ncbi:AAA family ATPase [Massilia sp. Root351]|uniref:AAA family ATPase n=1 Tax=Massilia sp. Root351 TaxID=1736522 RepID=UPI000AE74215|nr:AAA family ATPase [Massilia sp. Root351]
MPQLFKNLHLSNWRQYREVNIDFHERLTVITGGNGAGKTTVLNLLSRHFGWQGTVVSTPRRSGGSLKFSTDNWDDSDLKNYSEWLAAKEVAELGLSTSAGKIVPELAHQVNPNLRIGELTYGSGSVAELQVPQNVGAQFQVSINNQQNLRGMHVPSHRPIFSHQSVENIPTIPRRRDQAYQTYLDIVRARYYGGHHNRTPNYYMKETLIAWAAFGYGNSVIDRDSESLEMFEGFQKVLATVLPPSLGFKRIAIRLPEVVLITRSGDFSLDAVSGGISSLIDLVWQVFMYAGADENFAVTIDEPENHLHPELQRTVLGTLLTAFPHIQFICATHNPFIVTSVPDSSVYALRYGQDHKVISELLDSADRTGSSNEVLRDILGMPSSSPTWVEEKLRQIQSELAIREVTPALIEELQERLAKYGLQRYVPTALAQIVKDQLSNAQVEP